MLLWKSRNPVSSLLRQLRFGDPIVVVSGLPRSGTSMIMKMLAAGGIRTLTDSQREADTDNPDGYFEHERIKNLAQENDKAWIRAARGRSLKVISHLLSELPDENFYRVIFTLRDLDEVVTSQNLMLERRGQAKQLEDAQTRELYERHLLRALAQARGRANMEIMTVKYGEVVGDPSRCAADIDGFLGGGLDVPAMAGAVSPQLYRNRNPGSAPRVAAGAAQ
jgi:hypothetical protein